MGVDAKAVDRLLGAHLPIDILSESKQGGDDFASGCIESIEKIEGNICLPSHDFVERDLRAVSPDYFINRSVSTHPDVLNNIFIKILLHFV